MSNLATDGLLEIRLARALQAARKARGLTLAGAARYAGCAQSRWWEMEITGSVGNMQLQTLQRMAAAVGLRLDVALSRDVYHRHIQPNDGTQEHVG